MLILFLLLHHMLWKMYFPHQRSCIYFFYENPAPENLFSRAYSRNNLVCRMGFTVIILMFFYTKAIFYDFQNCFYYFIMQCCLSFCASFFISCSVYFEVAYWPLGNDDLSSGSLVSVSAVSRLNSLKCIPLRAMHIGWKLRCLLRRFFLFLPLHGRV